MILLKSFSFWPGGFWSWKGAIFFGFGREPLCVVVAWVIYVEKFNCNPVFCFLSVLSTQDMCVCIQYVYLRMCKGA